MDEFRHPGWVRAYLGQHFLAGFAAVLAAYFIQSEGLVSVPSAAAIALALTPLTSTLLSMRATSRIVRLRDSGVESWTFLGKHTFLVGSEIEAIEDFAVHSLASANRRIRVVSLDGAQVLFSDAITNFETLVERLAELAPQASRGGRQPWWKRLLMTG